MDAYQSPSKVPTQWATANPVPVGWMKQFRYFISLFDRVSHLDDDVVECGLGEGNTFAMLAYLIGSEKRFKRFPTPHRTLWGFDSFEGWPEPTAWDMSPRNPQKGEWKVGEEMITRRLEESGIYREYEYPDLDIKVRKGFLEETLPSFPDRPIVFLHLDVDLYPGYRDGLKYLFPKVVPGGVVLFDEYHEFPSGSEYAGGREKWPGCSKAIDEYFAGHQEIIEFHLETKKYFAVKQ